MIDELVDRLPTSNRLLLVALGDLTAIAAFVAVGELSHGSPIHAGVPTFLAFAVGWVAAALLLDAYDRVALSSLGRAAGRAAITWIGAVLLGHAVRVATVQGATLAPTFVLVSLAVGGGFVVVWRVFAALVFG